MNDDVEQLSGLRDELRAALAEWGVEANLLTDDRQSLVRSGALDSVALFDLSTWIEARIGRPVDPGSINVADAWDTIDAIVRFIVAPEGGSAPQAKPEGHVAPSLASPAVQVKVRDGARFDIARFRDEDLPSVTRLLTRLWSPDIALNQRVFDWKYRRNPFAVDPLIYLVRQEGKLIGMRALCEMVWEAEGLTQPATVYCADDLVVDEAHRSRGVFAQLTEHFVHDLAQRGHSFFVSLSALRVTRLQAVAQGAHSVPIGPPLGLRSDLTEVADRIAGGVEKLPLLWRVASRITAGDQAAASFARLDSAGHVADIEIAAAPVADAMAQLVARIGHDGRIRHVRDARFFGWRFDTPLHAYRFIFARRYGRLVGYLVLQRALSSLASQRRVNLIDWAVEDMSTLDHLLETTIAIGRFAELVTWGAAGDPSWEQALKVRGFEPTDLHQVTRGLPCIVVRAVDERQATPKLGRRSLLDRADWDLRMAYTSYA